MVIFFLPRGYGPLCNENRYPWCFDIQILFQLAWSIYTNRLIKKKNKVDLVDQRLEQLFRSEKIIKNEKKDDLDFISEDQREENHMLFHEIDGLEPNKKFDMIEMLRE